MGQGQGALGPTQAGWARLPLNKQAHLELRASLPLRHTPRLWLLFQGRAWQRETKGPGPRTLSQCSSHLGENRSPGGQTEGAAVSRYRRGRGLAQRRPWQGRERGNAPCARKNKPFF